MDFVHRFCHVLCVVCSPHLDLSSYWIRQAGHHNTFMKESNRNNQKHKLKATSEQRVRTCSTYSHVRRRRATRRRLSGLICEIMLFFSYKLRTWCVPGTNSSVNINSIIILIVVSGTGKRTVSGAFSVIFSVLPRFLYIHTYINKCLRYTRLLLCKVLAGNVFIVRTELSTNNTYCLYVRGGCFGLRKATGKARPRKAASKPQTNKFFFFFLPTFFSLNPFNENKALTWYFTCNSYSYQLSSTSLSRNINTF